MLALTLIAIVSIVSPASIPGKQPLGRRWKRENLIENGGFEKDIQGWSVSGGAKILTEKEFKPKFGKQSLLLGNGAISQVLQVLPGTRYIAQFALNTLDCKSKDVLGFVSAGKEKSMKFSQASNATDYSKVTYIFTVPGDRLPMNSKDFNFEPKTVPITFKIDSAPSDCEAVIDSVILKRTLLRQKPVTKTALK